MFYWTAFVTLFSFFMWIQPLGAFIRPSQESAACGGLRAFHMCSMQWSRSAAPTDKKSGISFTAPSASEKSKDSGSSGGHQFGHDHFGSVNPERFRSLPDPIVAALPVRLLLSGIDPVPKR